MAAKRCAGGGRGAHRPRRLRKGRADLFDAFSPRAPARDLNVGSSRRTHHREALRACGPTLLRASAWQEQRQSQRKENESREAQPAMWLQKPSGL